MRKTRRKRKLKIQTNEGQQLIIPPELYRSFQRSPPLDLHQQCLNLIRLRALEQAHRQMFINSKITNPIDRHVPWQKIKVQDPQGPVSSIQFRILGSQGPTSSIPFRIQGSQGPTSGIHSRILGSQGPMTSINFRIQSPQGPTN